MKNTIFVLAASLCAAACAFGAPKGKKPLYTNGEEAVKAAVACEQPILVFLTVKGSKQEGLINKKLLGDKAVNEFFRKNFVVWRATQKLGADKQPHLTGFTTNEVAMLKTFIPKDRETYHSVCAVLSADGKKCLKGYYGDGGMPAILELEDLHIWLPTMLCSLDAGKIPYEVTPALKKFLETPQDEPKAKGWDRNKKK